MKKIYLLLIITTFAAAGFVCKPANKYVDIKAFMNEVISAHDEYITALEKASTAKEVAGAITVLGNKMEIFSKKGAELEKKYPELINIDRATRPAELQEEYKKMEEISKRMMQVSMKMMKYMRDPEVMKATQEMAKKASKPGFLR